MKRLVVVALLAGCSSTPAVAPPPRDETLARLGHAGDIAYGMEEADQAAEQYAAALDRARERDDASAIADAGFNLATAELRRGKPREAIATAAELRAELARRGIADPAFDLVTATALFRQNRLAESDAMAATLTGGGKIDLADAAWFLRGLIADARGDAAGVRQAAAALSPRADAGDRAELDARLSHNPADALRAADIRRDALDYRGMARDLALAAQFTPDRAAAADLYLRAGRSAAARRDATDARLWLARARAVASDSALRGAADRALRDIKTPP